MDARRQVALLSGLALAMLGCAALGGRSQIVAIDSPRRGVAVSDAQGRALGLTPLFAEVGRGHRQHLRFRAAGGEEGLSVTCGYRPLASLAPNLALGTLAVAQPLAAAAIAAAANAVDVVTGAAWDCPTAIILPDAATPTAAERRCPVVLIAPPRDDDIALSRAFADAWWRRFAAAFPCAARVDPDLAERVLRRLGVGHEEGLRIARLSRAQLNLIGWRTHATHVAVVEPTRDGDLLRGAAVVHDLHTLVPTAGPAVAVPLADAGRPWWRRALGWLGGRTQWLPDSVGFAPASKGWWFKPAGAALSVTDEETPSRLPSILTGWTLTSVDHPGPHGAWDATLGLAPRAAFTNASRVVTATDGGSGVLSRQAVTLAALGATWGPTATLHTPAGAFSVTGAVGAIAMGHWRDGGWVGVRAPWLAAASVAWTGFASENLFVRVDTTIHTSREPQARDATWSLREWSAVTLTLGWYVPEWRTGLRGLF